MRHLHFNVFDYVGLKVFHSADLEAFHFSLDFCRYFIKLLLTASHLSLPLKHGDQSL